MSESAFEGLEPALVWSHFAALTAIARPSKQEGEAREHVLAWAHGRGLENAVDEAGNVVVHVPASSGREPAPTVTLQAHLDMVCERDPDSPYDPREGRIHVVRDDDWVAADGTTLGADNGIGVAAALAAAEDPALRHGPLELLLTVSEEQGLTGAKSLDPALVAGRRLVNLDGTSDEAITVGCAGSAHTFTRIALQLEPVPAAWTALEVVLSGARGGHSGGDIARGRANAIKGLGSVLSHASDRIQIRLARLEGGVSRNALPRDARAVVAVAANDAETFGESAAEALAALRARYAAGDAGLELSVVPAGSAQVAGAERTSSALDLLAATPSGVIAMSPLLPSVVETSTSLNVAETRDGTLTLASMTRSSSAAALDDVVSTLRAAARLGHAEIDVVRSYPPWTPDPDSDLLRVARSTFERLFDLEPGLEVVHGGLECAVLGEKLPGVEMISIGPEVLGPHAPGERLRISGTQRFYRLLGALLDDLSS